MSLTQNKKTHCHFTCYILLYSNDNSLLVSHTFFHFFLGEQEQSGKPGLYSQWRHITIKKSLYLLCAFIAFIGTNYISTKGRGFVGYRLRQILAMIARSLCSFIACRETYHCISSARRVRHVVGIRLKPTLPLIARSNPTHFLVTKSISPIMNSDRNDVKTNSSESNTPVTDGGVTHA